MGKKLNLAEVIPIFEKGKDFELTESQYEEKVGSRLPKTKYYIKNKSPLAEEARKHGYLIDCEDRPIIQRIVKFKKIQ